MKSVLVILALVVLSHGFLNGCAGRQLAVELNTTPPTGHPINSF